MQGPGTLIERERDLEAVGRVLGGTDSDGAVLLLRGAAGLGKTALLRATALQAESLGRNLLRATASDLDRHYPYGVVHQLLDAAVTDPARRDRLLVGAARHAEAVLFGAGGASVEGYAILHGLYWTLVNLAEEGPLVLLVDDLHWCDGPSLRLLEYLGRRLDGVAIALVATTRPSEPGAEQDLIAALGAGPSATVLDVGPLTEGAMATLVETALGRAPDAAFAAACADATRGNPLLLSSLLREAVSGGLQGAASEAGTATSLGAAGLAAGVARRLRALGATPTALGEALAVLGDLDPPGGREALQDISGLDGAQMLDALDALQTAELLQPGTRTFSHPLIAGAVRAAVPAGRQAQMHAAAAAHLIAAGARPAEVARHLLPAAPAGDPTVVAQLRAAAAGAHAEPAEAAVFLRRALAEPPPAELRVDVSLELGEALARAGDPEAAQTLDAVRAGATSPDVRARAIGARGTILVHSDPGAAFDDLEQAASDAADPALRLQLEALSLELSAFHVGFGARRAELLASSADPSPAMLAHRAIEANWRGEAASESVTLVRRALADGTLLEHVGAASSTYNLLVHTLRFGELPEATADLLRAGADASARRGTEVAAFFLDHAWAYWHHAFGSVGSGIGHAENGLRQGTELGFDITIPAFHAILCELLVEDDRAAEAAALLAPIGPGSAVEDTISGPFAISARGRAAWAEGRLDDAEADLRRCAAAYERRGWGGHVVRAELRLAEVLAQRGERAEATELADTQVALAERLGTAGLLGVARRVRGIVLGGDEGLSELHTAVALLHDSPLRLDEGWALHALGSAQRRAGERAAAREHLRDGLRLADAAAGRRLERLCREELAVAGGRPPRAAGDTRERLTPAELRVAELAADGLGNRAIAETLWVTRKTVELHLTRSYEKLGIRSRHDLPRALGRGAH